MVMNYLIYGNSYKLIEDEINKITTNNNKTIYFLDEVGFDVIIEDISYNSLFEEEKVIIIKRVEKLFKTKQDTDKESKQKELEALHKYLESPNKNIILILESTDKINTRSKLNKEILSKLNIIETPVYTKAYEMAKDVEKIIRKDGYAISQNDLNNFITRCSINYDVFCMEWEKFKKIHPPGVIKPEYIDEDICNYNLDDFFAFKDAVINKDIDKANKLLDDLIVAKCMPLPLVVMLANEYRVLYDIKYLSLKEYTNEKISKELDNMHPFRVKNLRISSNKYALSEIEKDIKYLCELDYKLVSQDNLGLEEIRKFLLEL